jgi:hypothetical protein
VCVCVCVCVCLYLFLVYPAGKSHILWATLYSHQWPVWMYHVYQHNPTNGTTFSTNFVRNVIFILKGIQRDIVINIFRSSCK